MFVLMASVRPPLQLSDGIMYAFSCALTGILLGKAADNSLEG